ncbi:hypothetical protein ACHAWF_014585 [Thalassiosira exigua]
MRGTLALLALNPHLALLLFKETMKMLSTANIVIFATICLAQIDFSTAADKSLSKYKYLNETETNEAPANVTVKNLSERLRQSAEHFHTVKGNVRRQS